MSSDHSLWCRYCGNKDGYNCTHDGHGEPNKSVETLPSMEEETGYDPGSCNSLDHRSPILISQGIHFALMRYFGDSSGNMLNYEWLKTRGKLEPLYDWGAYFTYRKGYQFGDG